MLAFAGMTGDNRIPIPVALYIVGWPEGGVADKADGRIAGAVVIAIPAVGMPQGWS